MNASTVQYEGIKVKLGGEERTLAPLTLRALRKLKPQLKLLSVMGEELPTDDQISAIVAVVCESLKRNYTEVNPDDVEDWLDVGNLPSVIAATMSIAGMEKAAEGGAPGGA